MFQTNGGEDGHLWHEHIGGIQATSQTHFDHGNVDLMAGKVQERQCRDQFKERPEAPLVCEDCLVHPRLQLAYQSSKLLTTDQLSVNLGALSYGHQVWTGE